MNTDPSRSDAPDFAAEACQEINTYVNHNYANYVLTNIHINYFIVYGPNPTSTNIVKD
jgi:hypothetical protein